MLGINLKHSLVTVAAVAGLIVYNGHAGLGSNEARAAAVTDGTSNTVMFGHRAGAFILMADAGGQ